MISQFITIGTPFGGEFTVGGYDADPILGVGDVARFEVSTAADSYDIEVRIDFDEATFVGDEDPTLLESDISYTIKVGAGVTVTHAMPIDETTGQVEMTEGDGSQGTWFTWNVELDRAVDVDHEIDWSVSGAGEFGVTAEDFEVGVPSGRFRLLQGETTGTISFQVAGARHGGAG